MKKSITKVLALILATTLSFSGCSQNNITITEAVDETELEVSWWGTDERHSYTIAALKEYSNQNPGLRINMTYGEFSGFEMKNDVKMFANTAADVMQINYPWLEKYQGLGLEFYDLSTLSDILDLSQYDENELSYGTNSDGTLIALPIASNVKVVWYNKSIYDKYGLELPETWDDLIAAAKVMNPDGIYPIDIDATSTWMCSVAYIEQTTGKSVFDENQSFNFSLEDVKNMISFYLNLLDNGVMECLGDRSESRLREGVYAGSMQWVSGAAKYENMIITNGGTVAVGLPLTTADAKRSGWYVKPATLYSISSQTENPEEAAKLLSYLVQDEGMVLRQKLDKGVPCNAKAIEILEAAGELSGIQYEATVLAEQQNYNKMSPYLELTEYSDILTSAINDVQYGEETLDKAASIAYKALLDVEKSR